MQVLVALLAGLVFGIGLTVAQKIDAAKVLGFLDLGAMTSAGWDLVGYRPGPAPAGLGFDAAKTFGFVGAATFGMLLHHLALERR